MGRSVSAAMSRGHEVWNLALELGRIPAVTRHHRASPPPTGLVLEVGGGQRPHPRSDVVVDKYPADDFERAGPLNLSKALIVADGEQLPFADDGFAYVIGEHVLEHATDPTLFAEELSRVAAAGFVQVPSRANELVYGWPFHPWLIDLEADTLVFRPRGEEKAPVGELMHAQYVASPTTRIAFAARRSDWHHSVHWEGRLEVRVAGASSAEQTAVFDADEVIAMLGSATAPPLPSDVIALLRCPACRSELAEGAGAFGCHGCGLRYPIVGNVPLLLVDVGGTA